MMRQGRSFSGREQNCCFLNTMSNKDARGRFANISAASGLDFPDDGRAIGSLDWDHDGDLDIWVTNRNAPRLRLMRNDTEQQNHYIAVRLIGNGTSVNRDAIGARLEVVTSDDPNAVHIKTVRAGDAFLSQSSKWLHFGLGERGSVQSVRVLWPDGSKEEFGPIASNRRYQIVQASGQADVWNPPKRSVAISAGKPTLPTRSATARIPLVFPLRVPSMSYRGFDGRDRDLPIGRRPLLINLWASWCAPCLAELQELKEQHNEFSDAGLEVFALSVDGLRIGQTDERQTVHPNADEQIIADMSPPFVSGRATQQVIETLQFLHDLVIHSRKTLPIPTSMLLDRDGRLITIYKGVVPVERVCADLETAQATFVERQENAAMVDGSVLRHDLMQDVARRSHAYTLFQAGFAMRASDRIEDAIRYFSDAVQVTPRSIASHLFLGHTLRDAEKYREAVAEYEAALRIDSDRAEVQFNLANTFEKLDQHAQAVERYKQAIRVRPDYFEARINCAIVLNAMGRVDESIAQYQAAIKVRPNSARAHQQLGSTLLSVDRLELAEMHFQQALRIAPDDVEAHSGIGRVFVRQKLYKQALSHFESAVELRPDSAVAHVNLGNALQLAGRNEEAVQAFATASRLAPNSAETHNNWGAALQALDRFDEAMTHYETALHIDPRLATAHRNWGRALQLQGSFEQAATHFQAAVEINPKFGKAYYELGQTQLMLNQATRALTNLQKAVQLMPRNAAAHRDYGRALVIVGSLKDGIGEYRKSLELKPNDLQTLNNLAWLLATCDVDRVRDGQQAVILARRAARLTNSKNPSVLDTLAAAYAEVGDFEQAIRWQTRAIKLSPNDRKAGGRAKLKRYESGRPFRETLDQVKKTN